MRERQGLVQMDADGSLRAIGVTPVETMADLDWLERLVQRRGA